MLGIPVFDADKAAKEIMETDPVLKDALINAFGIDTYRDNKLNRKYLADIVFNDLHQLEKLNALVHPPALKATDKNGPCNNMPPILLKKPHYSLSQVLRLDLII